MIDRVDEVEEIVGLEAVLVHQPAHRGTVALVVVLLYPERLIASDVEEARDVVADAIVDLLPQIEVVRVERIVEVENPGLDLPEIAGWLANGWFQGHVGADLARDPEKSRDLSDKIMRQTKRIESRLDSNEALML